MRKNSSQEFVLEEKRREMRRREAEVLGRVKRVLNWFLIKTVRDRDSLYGIIICMGGMMLAYY